jgi:hypothetical protein
MTKSLFCAATAAGAGAAARPITRVGAPCPRAATRLPPHEQARLTAMVLPTADSADGADGRTERDVRLALRA